MIHQCLVAGDLASVVRRSVSGDCQGKPSPSQYPLCREAVDQRSWDVRQAAARMPRCGCIEMKMARSPAGFLSSSSSPRGCLRSFLAPRGHQNMRCDSTPGHLSSPARSLPGTQLWARPFAFPSHHLLIFPVSSGSRPAQIHRYLLTLRTREAAAPNLSGRLSAWFLGRAMVSGGG